MSASLLHDPERFVAAAAASLMKTEAEILAEAREIIAKGDVTEAWRPEFIEKLARLENTAELPILFELELKFRRTLKITDLKRRIKTERQRQNREARAKANRTWYDLLDLHETTSKINPTFDNAATFLEHHPIIQGVFGYNEFSSQVELLRHPPDPICGEAGDALSDEMLVGTVRWLESHGLYVKFDLVARVVNAVAKENSHHPLREWLGSLVWDGEPRLEEWAITYLGVESSDSSPNEYAMAVGAKTLIAAVARVFHPGCKADCMLVLEGGQGKFKSTAASILGGQYYTDQIGDITSKDSSMVLHGAWIIEVPELDSFCRYGVTSARIKAFVSQTDDRYRPPYGRCVIRVPRQCVFIGTTNSTEWLKDETGGRRFWPLRCGQIDQEGLRRDRDQIWAEAVVRFQEGATWWLEDAHVIERATQEQADRYAPDPLFEKIIAAAEEEASLPISDPRESASVSEILARLGFGNDQQNHAIGIRVSGSLTHAGWEKFRAGKRGEYRPWRYRKVVSK